MHVRVPVTHEHRHPGHEDEHGGDLVRSDPLAQHRQSDERAHEGRRREERGLPGRTDETHCLDARTRLTP